MFSAPAPCLARNRRASRAVGEGGARGTRAAARTGPRVHAVWRPSRGTQCFFLSPLQLQRNGYLRCVVGAHQASRGVGAVLLFLANAFE